MTDWRLPGFTEVRELGRGAQGRVVLARDDARGELVAIKYLASEHLTDERALERFRGEARTLARVDDPHVARLHELRETPQGAAIVMEAVDGVALRVLLDRYEPMSPESALVILKGSLLGLAAAHAVGVVHRDYKPANVVVRADGLSKLIDFGVAGLAGSSSGSGTPLYMAPEQWAGGPASPATDVYAATCVFFECVTGRRPYEAPGRAALMRQHLTDPVPVQQVPEPVRELVARGMAKDPAHRPPGAAAFVAELEAVAGRAYGPDWESRGWDALAMATTAVAALFPLALAGGGAAAGVISSAGAGAAQAGGQAAGTGLLATTATKVTVAVAATATIATAGTGAYVAVTEDRPGGGASTGPSAGQQISIVPAALNQTVPVPGRPALQIRNSRYIQVTGMADAALQRRVNQALRAPLDRAINRFRAYLQADQPNPSDVPRCGEFGSSTNVRLDGPRLVSVRYTFTSRTCTVADEDPDGSDSVTVDLRTGRTLRPADIFTPATLTPAGLRTLTGLFPPATPARQECGYRPPLRRAQLEPGPVDERSGGAEAAYIQLTFTPKALEFAFSGGLPCPQGLIMTVPYERLRGLLRTELMTALTAPTPERS